MWRRIEQSQHAQRCDQHRDQAHSAQPPRPRDRHIFSSSLRPPPPGRFTSSFHFRSPSTKLLGEGSPAYPCHPPMIDFAIRSSKERILSHSSMKRFLSWKRKKISYDQVPFSVRPRLEPNDTTTMTTTTATTTTRRENRKRLTSFSTISRAISIGMRERFRFRTSHDRWQIRYRNEIDISAEVTHLS